MMYKLSNTIKEVKGVKAYSKTEIIGYFNRELFVDSKKIGSNVDTTTGSLKIFKSFLFFDVKDSIHIYELNNGETFDLEQYRPYPNSLENNEIICTYDTGFSDNKFSWKTGLFDFKNKQLIKEYEFLKDISIAYYLYKDFVIVYKKPNLLGGLSIFTGSYNWEVDLETYCQYTNWEGRVIQDRINHIIGVYQNKLWLMCANRRLMGLCLKTGEILANVWLGDLRTELQDLVILSPPIFDKATDEFVFCTYKYYFTIDAQSLSINQFYQIPFEGRADNIQTQVIHEGLVYFTGQHFLPNDTYESQVGIYNPKTNTVLWSYSLNTIVNQVPQVSENRLYILDTDGVLHIFERED